MLNIPTKSAVQMYSSAQNLAASPVRASRLYLAHPIFPTSKTSRVIHSYAITQYMT